MLSAEAIEHILGLKERTVLRAEEMAKQLNVTFYPVEEGSILSSSVESFTKDLKEALLSLGTNVVPYTESLEKVPVSRRIKRFVSVLLNNFLYFLDSALGRPTTRHFISREALWGILKKERIKNGISVVVAGENRVGNLPIEKTSSFRHSSVITVLDRPESIDENSSFEAHFDTAMSMFAYHMTNIVILADDKKWILYNFNASHPVYDRKQFFKEHILHALIPKVVAPIRPYRFSDFKVLKEKFDPRDAEHSSLVEDLMGAGKKFETLGLYPKGKKIDDLPFRTDFYRWIGKIHLDDRSGMSYGFLARQMPVGPEPLLSLDSLKPSLKKEIEESKDYFYSSEGDLFIILELSAGKFCLRVPDVWVLSQRSGSNKTNMNPDKDLVKLGLKNGVMLLQTPRGLALTPDYKPSFDTGVMLANAVSNAIVSSILEFLEPGNAFTSTLRTTGLSLSHWHGYINPGAIPPGWHVHGSENPHVSCSSPQSAVYAFVGKLGSAERAIKNKEVFLGDIHIEPHHGTNITFQSLAELTGFFLKNPGTATLGNKYLSEGVS